MRSMLCLVEFSLGPLKTTCCVELPAEHAVVGKAIGAISGKSWYKVLQVLGGTELKESFFYGL